MRKKMMKKRMRMRRRDKIRVKQYSLLSKWGGRMYSSSNSSNSLYSTTSKA
jgi:hypothetical protein